MNFISGIIQNSVAGFVDAGMKTAGGYAGDFLIKAGDSIESAGVAYGNAVAGKFENWGGSIGGAYGNGLPATGKKAITAGNGAASRPKQLKRSNSMPASTKQKVSTTVTKPSAPKSSASKSTALKSTGPKAVTPKSIASRPAASAKSRAPSAPPTNKFNGQVKYTPGVLTGMPKSTPSLNKSANGATNKAGGDIKYTPGKLTGMPPKPSAAKSTPSLNFPPPSKPPLERSTSNPTTSKKSKKDKKNKKDNLPSIERTFF